jgi:putative ABC transport system permease protein
METLVHDVRYAIRSLLKSPAFAIIAVLTLALGIGANTALFSVVNAVLLRPLPYAEPERVVILWNSWPGWDKTWLSEPEIVDYRAGTPSLTGIAPWSTGTANVTGSGEPERVSIAYTTANLFEILGVQALLGRTFGPEEDAPGGDGVVVLGHGLWQRRFGSDRSIIGKTVRIDASDGDRSGERIVIGVLPPSFVLPLDYKAGARPAELYVPLALNYDSLGSRGSHYLNAVARLAPGAGVERANTELKAVVRRLVDQGHLAADQATTFRPFVTYVSDEVLGNVRPALLVLLGAVAFVLLIACANVANLLLARSDARTREIAVRSAIGAARWRIVRQLITESLVLALAGGMLGLLLAFVALKALVALDPASLPRVQSVALSAPVLAFTCCIILLTGVLFGSAPAVRLLNPNLAGTLREGGRGSTVGRTGQRLRRGIVIAEIALSVILVVGAGLMIRTLWELQRIDLGYQPDRVLTARLTPPTLDFPDDAAVVAFYDRLLKRIEELPGVERAGATRLLPLTGEIGDWSIRIEGRVQSHHDNPNGDWQVVTPGYLEAMGIPLVRGRYLSPDDHAGAPIAVVINEAMASAYWPGEDALGKRFAMGQPGAPWSTVVGIVRNVRHNAIVEETRSEMYHAHAQFPERAGFAPRAMTLTISTRAEPLALVAPIRTVVRAQSANLAISDVQTMQTVVDDAFSQPRFLAGLLLMFALVALLLGAVGIYGVIAYGVAQRRGEIGIRMALGASAGSVVGMIVRSGAALALFGVIAGVALAALLTRLVGALVYGIEPLDLPTFAAVPLVLGTVALAATWLPARRAAGIDPVEALRSE